MTLSIGSLLQGGKYKIDNVLGLGGFGITYLAEQTMLERKVAIKEFFMKEFCERDESTSHVTMGTAGARETVERFREKFLKEARNIAKLKHPHIIQILDVFEENGTAYYVMEYAENGSLLTLVADNKPLPEAQATRYILQVADALAYIHERKMNHLDIKPGNIMLNEKDEAVLIDFGLSKQYDDVGQQTSTTPVGMSEGYAPMEQYKQGGVKEFSPETDIYALGATFFKLLTGVTPPGASDVNEDGLPVNELLKKGVSQVAIDVITKAMEPRRKKRFQYIGDFVEVLRTTSPADTHQTAGIQSEETKVVQSDVQDDNHVSAETSANIDEVDIEAKIFDNSGNEDSFPWKSKSLWISILILIIPATILCGIYKHEMGFDLIERLWTLQFAVGLGCTIGIFKLSIFKKLNNLFSVLFIIICGFLWAEVELNFLYDLQFSDVPYLALIMTITGCLFGFSIIFNSKNVTINRFEYKIRTILVLLFVAIFIALSISRVYDPFW